MLTFRDLAIRTPRSDKNEREGLDPRGKSIMVFAMGLLISIIVLIPNGILFYWPWLPYSVIIIFMCSFVPATIVYYFSKASETAN
jgi:hypothetical protein